MKKLILIAFYFLFTGAMVTSQVSELEPVVKAQTEISAHDVAAMAPDTATASAERLRLDSTNVEDVNTTAWQLANVLNGYAQFIPGVPNIILQTITGVILALIVRRREKRALRKKGLLKDIPPVDHGAGSH